MHTGEQQQENTQSLFSAIKPVSRSTENFVCKVKTLPCIDSIVLNLSWGVPDSFGGSALCDDSHSVHAGKSEPGLQWVVLCDTGECHQKQLQFILHLIFDFSFVHCNFRNLLLLPDFFYDPLYHIQLRDLPTTQVTMKLTGLRTAHSEVSIPLHMLCVGSDLYSQPFPAASWPIHLNSGKPLSHGWTSPTVGRKCLCVQTGQTRALPLCFIILFNLEGKRLWQVGLENSKAFGRKVHSLVDVADT